jgi:hypothetical protein
MPYLLDLCTREIFEVKQIPGNPSDWISVNIDAKRLRSTSPHEIEFEYFPSRGLLNGDQLIVEDWDEAFDIEYYTREGTLKWTYGEPNQIRF